MASAQFVQVQTGVQYDGTNSAEIVALYPTFTSQSNPSITYPPEIGSETGGVLTIHYDNDDAGSGPLNFPINEGQWVLPEGMPSAVDGVALADVIDN